jgi:hypothetical protein
MVRRFSTCCLCFCAFSQAVQVHADIQVGAASRVITPDPLLPISGGMGVPMSSSRSRQCRAAPSPTIPGWLGGGAEGDAPVSRASPATATLQETRKDAVLDLPFRNLSRIILF